MHGYFWTQHQPSECLVVIKFYDTMLLFLQGLLDPDVRGKLRFNFKSKGLGQQKLKKTVYSLDPGEIIEHYEILSR